jgi:hypothetical protein
LFQPSQVLYVFTAAGTAKKSSFSPPAGERWRVKAIEHCPNATLALDATHYASIRCYSGATAITAARTTAASALTALTPEAHALTAGQGDCEVTSTSPFSVQVTHAGSGGAVDMNTTVTFERLNAPLA